MSETKKLPTWAEDLRKRYLRGESSMFILHGNVFDIVLNDNKMLSLTEFLTTVLLNESRENIIVYNLSSGASFPKKSETFSNWQEISVESIINKRIERVAEIRRYLKIAYGQINLIENSFQLLADQIVTMQSPNELSGQLDELLDGVESIKETAKETEQILKTL